MSQQFPYLDVDDEISSVVEGLFTKILQFNDTIERLDRQLQDFPDRLTAERKKNPLVDRQPAMAIHNKCCALLKICKADPTADMVPALLAAIDYFVSEEDGTPDYASIDGFDDDEELIDKLISHFKLEDKVAELREGAA